MLNLIRVWELLHKIKIKKIILRGNEKVVSYINLSRVKIFIIIIVYVIT